MHSRPIRFGDYFIIEHPTRGTLKFFVSEEEYGFSSSGRRNDPDRTLMLHSVQEARRIMGKLPERVSKRCQILDARRSFEPVD